MENGLPQLRQVQFVIVGLLMRRQRQPVAPETGANRPLGSVANSVVVGQDFADGVAGVVGQDWTPVAVVVQVAQGH